MSQINNRCVGLNSKTQKNAPSDRHRMVVHYRGGVAGHVEFEVDEDASVGCSARRRVVEAVYYVAYNVLG